jgi:class 3 adenylate cyclase
VGQVESPQQRTSSIQRLSELVDPSSIDLGGRTSPEGAVTILFSDIEGSTEMVERLGDEEWVRVLRVHNDLVRKALARNGGVEVKAQGDGFMLAFMSSRAALRCAVEMQQSLEHHGSEHEGDRVRVRIGLHAGFMIQEGPDYFGRNVILAARIADRARGGEVLVSAPLKEFVETAGGAAFLEPQELALKGLAGTHRVYPVDWRSAAWGATASS